MAACRRRSPRRVNEIWFLSAPPGEPTVERQAAGMQRFASARGWGVRMFSREDSRLGKLDALPERPLGCIVDCIVSWDPGIPRNWSSIPFVFFERQGRVRCLRSVDVVNDGASVARAAFRELALLRPPAYAVVGHGGKVTWQSVRIRTFTALAAEAGRTCFVFGRRSEDAATRRDRLEQWLGRLPGRCAVFAVNDEVACEVLACCRRIGKSVPKEMSLIGVDNLADRVGWSEPDLSSVSIDFEMAGYRMAMLLSALVDGKSMEGMKTTYGPLMVVRRKSTGGSGRYDAQVVRAVERIRREACRGLTARDVVADFPCSRRLVELRFRESIGHSILDEIENVRMMNVSQMLRDRAIPLDLVFAHSGYPSVEALRKAFRLRTGQSLTSWRNANSVV